MINYNEFLHNLTNLSLPSDYLHYLKSSNLLGYYRELNALVGCIHDPEWHSEGDVWVHTLMVVDVASDLKFDIPGDDERLAFMLGALCHDLGKPFTTEYSDTRIRSIMHDQIGVFATKSFLSKLMVDDYIKTKVISYVANHLIPMQFHKNSANISEKAFRKLEDRIHIPHLALLTRADHWGRKDEDATNRICPAADFLMAKYNSIFI